MSPLNASNSLIEAASRRLAAKLSRRSLFGQLGRGSVALALGGAVAGLEAAPAEAYHINCGCNGTPSVACGNLPGWGQNTCPGTSCTCGYWVNCGGSGSGCPVNTLWADCCGECNDNNAYCIVVGGVSRPTCCNQRAYTQGCLSGSAPHIKCRVWQCTSMAC